MQPMPPGRVAARNGCETSMRRPLDQLLHLRRAEDRQGELVPPVPGHEHAARVVDPQLSTGRLTALTIDGTYRLTCTSLLQ